MKRLIPILFILATFNGWLHGQVTQPPGVILVGTAPSGACTAGVQGQMVTSTGAIWTCQSGTWATVGGGGAFNALSKDAISTATGGVTTVVGINGTLLSGLATGPLCNTTSTGVPSICAVSSGAYLSTTQVGGGTFGNNVTTVAGSSDVVLGPILTVSAATTIGHIIFHTGVADVTGTNFYMVGLMPLCAATTSCTPVASTGALAGGSTGIGTTGLKGPIALTASVALAPGQYQVITCGTATTWQAQGSNTNFVQIPYSGTTTSSVCSSSGFPATVTMPSAGAAETNGVPQFTFVP